MEGKPAAINLKLVPWPSEPRTIFNQKDPATPVFVGTDWGEPDWNCGNCDNVLATDVTIQPYGQGAMRFLPPATGGEVSLLSVSIPQGTYIQSEGGSMLVRCARCG